VDKNTGILVCVGVFVVAVAAGIWLIMLGLRNRKLAIASRSWPTAPGDVLSSEITSRTATETVNNSRRRVTYYTPVVRYAYVVGGTRYEADVIRFGSPEENYRPRAQEYCDRYPVGATVSVRYDPQNPKTATLETVSEAGLQIWMGALLIAAGVLLSALLWYVSFIR
jgi:hypothetical protein